MNTKKNRVYVRSHQKYVRLPQKQDKRTPKASNRDKPTDFKCLQNPKKLQKHETYIQFVSQHKNLQTQAHIDGKLNCTKAKNKQTNLNQTHLIPFFNNRRSALFRHSSNSNTPRVSASPKVSEKYFPKQKIHSPQQNINLSFFVNGKKKFTSNVSQSFREKTPSDRFPPEKLINKTMHKNESKKRKWKKISEKKDKEKEQLEAEQIELREKLFSCFEFCRELGTGAHAVVRSAIDWKNKRKVAIKVFDKQEISESDIKSIEKQIQILNKLNHQHIVSLYQIIETFKTINLIMEYGGGNSLQQYIRSKAEGYLHENEAKGIFKQILQTVQYLHANYITHRDIKTQNILLNKHLQVKIIDFGFSLICQDKMITSYCGTPTYMAPEVVSKTCHNPLLSDRWSLGILLFCMLNGKCPFRASTQKQLFEKIRNGTYTFSTEVSKEGKELIQRFLQKTPSERISAKLALQHPWFS